MINCIFRAVSESKTRLIQQPGHLEKEGKQGEKAETERQNDNPSSTHGTCRGM